METNEMLPLVQLSRSGSSEGKLTLNKQTLANVFRDIENLPVVTINIAGPLSNGKSLLFGYLVRRLLAAELEDKFDWVDSKNPEREMSEVKWLHGEKNSPNKPGIWCYSRPFILPEEGSREDGTAVVLLYTQSSDNPSWDIEATDIAALMGLSMLISSTTIFNVYKNLNEQCISAVGHAIKYAIQGLPKSNHSKKGKASKATSKPFQNAAFLVRDWNFPSEFPYGTSGGKKFVKEEKLGVKPEHSKASRQSRQLINGLFETISGCLLPFPGNNVIASEFTGSIAEMDQKFAKLFTDFISSVIDVDQLPIKRNVNGDITTGRKLKEILENFISRVGDVDVSKVNPLAILHRFKVKVPVSIEEQKEHVKLAMKAYTEVWKKFEKGGNYFDDKELKNIQKKAKDQAVKIFEQEMKLENDDEDDDNDSPDDDSDDEGLVSKTVKNVRKLLMDRIAKRFEEIKKENAIRKKAYFELCKNELLQQYRECMEATFPEDGKRPKSENFVRKESKEAMANINGEYLERLGANADVDNLDDEQEQEMNDFKNLLKKEEKRFLDGLFGRRKVNNEDEEENGNSSDDGIRR